MGQVGPHELMLERQEARHCREADGEEKMQLLAAWAEVKHRRPMHLQQDATTAAHGHWMALNLMLAVVLLQDLRSVSVGQLYWHGQAVLDWWMGHWKGGLGDQIRLLAGSLAVLDPPARHLLR